MAELKHTSISMEMDFFSQVKEAAKKEDMTVAAYFRRAAREKMLRDNPPKREYDPVNEH